MAEISLGGMGGGHVATVDDEHYEYLSQWNWYASKNKSGNVYAVRQETIGGKRTNIRMHRVVAELAGMMIDGKPVDHKESGDTLDNRESNLRPASQAENGRNRGKQRNNTSGIKGVSLHKATGKHTARIEVGGILICLGNFDDKADAKIAYTLGAIKHHGEFAADENGPIDPSKLDIAAMEARMAELRNRPPINSTTGYVGVTRKGNKYESAIRHQGKRQYLGTYDSPIRAAFARDLKATELQGDKARLNFAFLA